MSANPEDHMTDAGRREMERRWQALWERSLSEAISRGLPNELAARTMMAAGMKLLLQTEGPQRMAYYLGRVAFELEQAAGESGEVVDPANLNFPPRH